MVLVLVLVPSGCLAGTTRRREGSTQSTASGLADRDVLGLARFGPNLVRLAMHPQRLICLGRWRLATTGPDSRLCASLLDDAGYVLRKPWPPLLCLRLCTHLNLSLRWLGHASAIRRARRHHQHSSCCHCMHLEPHPVNALHTASGQRPPYIVQPVQLLAAARQPPPPSPLAPWSIETFANTLTIRRCTQNKLDTAVPWRAC